MEGEIIMLTEEQVNNLKVGDTIIMNDVPSDVHFELEGKIFEVTSTRSDKILVVEGAPYPTLPEIKILDGSNDVFVLTPDMFEFFNIHRR